MEKPYIGITGVSEIEDAKAITQAFSQHLPESATHQGMIGYLVSLKTLKGQRERVEKYPPVNKLAELLTSSQDPKVSSAIHYWTPDRNTLAEQVTDLFTTDAIYESRLCRTLQLNMFWPDTTNLALIKNRFPNLHLVLQLGSRILNRESHVDIATRLDDYDNLADYILIDPSGGRTRILDTSYAVSLYRAIKHHLPDKTIVFAGGLDDRNVLQRLHELANLLRHRDFSIDSEGGLRELNRSDPHSGTLSIKKAVNYIEKSAAFFNRE